MKKILLFTFTRADFGYLNPLINILKNNKNINFKLAVSGSHLSANYGSSINEIKKNNIKIDFKLNLNLKNDTASEITNSYSELVKSVKKTLINFKPHLIIIFGDRVELLAVASTSIIYKIPIAHIYGGEVTLGAIDDSVRNALTKLSHLHFVRNKASKKRVVQLGETEKNVKIIGNLSEENFKKSKILNKKELEKKLKIKFKKKNFLITFHPETVYKGKSLKQIKTIINVLKKFENYGLFFTLPNYDNEASIIKKRIVQFAKKNKYAKVFKFLGHQNYVSLLKNSDCVIGNSSSGIIEAPYLNVPTINIGDRQAGREKMKSIINVDFNQKRIYRAIKIVINKKNKNVFSKNKSFSPSKKILNKILKTNLNEVFIKRFVDFNR